MAYFELMIIFLPLQLTLIDQISLLFQCDLVNNNMQSGRRNKCKSQPKQNFEHKKHNHLNEDLKQYQFPLFQNGWSIYLEVLLIDALRRFGCENWITVAQYLKSTFTPQEVRDHYYRVYGANKVENNYLPEEKDWLIADSESEVYILAANREKYRLARQEKQMKRKLRGDNDDYDNIEIDYKAPKKQPKPVRKIPIEFGYQQSKKIFAQPFNEQAEVMIIGLKINKDDDPSLKQSKIQVLKEYNRLIQERRIVEKQIMDNNLMECKYSITKSNLILKIPKNIEIQMTNGRRAKANNKNKSKSKGSKAQDHKKEDLFFKIRRREHQQLCEQLQVVYMKAAKFDQNETLKNLLKKYQEVCAELKHMKDQAQSNL